MPSSFPLSEHFTLAEMTVTQTDIANLPDATALRALAALCVNIMEPVRSHFGLPVVVNSAYRSPTVNELNGGKTMSQHLLGEACDFHIPGVANADIWRFIQGSDLPFDQLIAERLKRRDPDAGWIHVSYRAGRVRKDAISFLGNNLYVRGLQFVD